jgi:hypothetical protein
MGEGHEGSGGVDTDSPPSESGSRPVPTSLHPKPSEPAHSQPPSKWSLLRPMFGEVAEQGTLKAVKIAFNHLILLGILLLFARVAHWMINLAVPDEKVLLGSTLGEWSVAIDGLMFLCVLVVGAFKILIAYTFTKD